MRRVSRKYKKNNYDIIITHIQSNIKEYTIASIIFLIGILLGIVFVNNLNDVQTNDITAYITSSITALKDNNTLNQMQMLKENIKQDIFTVAILWIMGSTVIGLLLVYLIVCFKGFCLGYTISSIIFTLGTGKGIIFFISSMFLKNLIVIPATIALAVSGMRLYNSIMQDRRKENIKLEIVRHTIFAIFILILFVSASFIEVFISTNILKSFAKYL